MPLGQRPHEVRYAKRPPGQPVDATEVEQRAIRHPGAGPEHVVDHVAVGDRPRAAGVVARHAAQRGLGARRHVHRKPQVVFAEARVQVVEHDARLHLGGEARRVHFQDAVEVLRAVDDERGAGGLAALAGTGASRQHGYVQVAGDVQRDGDVFLGAGHQYADRHDLVNGSVRGIAATGGGVEHHLAAGLPTQPTFQRHAHVIDAWQHACRCQLRHSYLSPCRILGRRGASVNRDDCAGAWGRGA